MSEQSFAQHLELPGQVELWRTRYRSLSSQLESHHVEQLEMLEDQLEQPELMEAWRNRHYHLIKQLENHHVLAFVECPYNSGHRMPAAALAKHMLKCASHSGEAQDPRFLLCFREHAKYMQRASEVHVASATPELPSRLFSELETAQIAEASVALHRGDPWNSSSKGFARPSSRVFEPSRGLTRPVEGYCNPYHPPRSRSRSRAPEAPALPSKGSKWHAGGFCKPCFLLSRCERGADCHFCHFAHEGTAWAPSKRQPLLPARVDRLQGRSQPPIAWSSRATPAESRGSSIDLAEVVEHLHLRPFIEAASRLTSTSI